MYNMDSAYLFLFVFSILSVLRTVFKFVSSLLQDPPQRMVLSSWELIFIGLSISYCLTYLIKM